MDKHKVIFLGECNVGKTSILNRIMSNTYFEYQANTIGFTFNQLHYPKYNLKIDIWDTAGQDRYRSLTSLYYRDCSLAIIVYDVSNSQTFDKAKTWLHELQMNTPNTKILLVGNKIDLNQNVLKDDGIKLSIKYHSFFLETSAKNNIGIQDLSEKISNILDNIPKQIILELDTPNNKCYCLIT